VWQVVSAMAVTDSNRLIHGVRFARRGRDVNSFNDS
jgi:hypothetical protein